MELGVAIFSTDLTASPAQVAQAAEERGFYSVYVPEHTHMPVDPKGPLPPGAGELEEGYRRTLDPYVALGAAAAVTSRIRLGIGVALVAEHDPIALAKQIATLDHISSGRFVLGVGYGWNRAEAAHHHVDFGSRRELVREYMLAMGALWTKDVASYEGEFVRFDDSWSWPKPTQQPRVRTLLGGAPSARLFAQAAEWGDGWIPFGGAGIKDALPDLHRAFESVGRDPASAWVASFGTLPDPGKLEYFRELGVQETVLRIPATGIDEVRRALDEYTTYL